MYAVYGIIKGHIDLTLIGTSGIYSIHDAVENILNSKNPNLEEDIVLVQWDGKTFSGAEYDPNHVVGKRLFKVTKNKYQATQLGD